MSDRPSDEAKAARQSLDELPLLPARCSGAMAKDHGDANTFIAVMHIEVVHGNLGHRGDFPDRHRSHGPQKK
jgi:hypothetical protein